LRITPLDIYQQEFKRVLRGVDPDEVEDFLERVADDYEQIIKENAALKEQIESLKVQLAAGGKTEQVDALETTTREEAANITREARKEADNLIREARKEADNIIRKAEAIAREARESRVAESEEVGIKSKAGEIPSEAAAREADSLMEKTRAEAGELQRSLQKAKTEELELRREISRLRGQKERFLIEYRELLEKHLKLLTERA